MKTRLCSASAGVIPGWTFPASCRWPRRRRRLAARWSMSRSVSRRRFRSLRTECASTPVQPPNGLRERGAPAKSPLQCVTMPPFMQPSLRTMVSQRVTPSEYKTLVASRQRYPGSGTYGVIFWQKQLDHIEREGTPDIFVTKVTLATTLSFPWLKGDAELTWRTAPGGRRRSGYSL